MLKRILVLLFALCVFQAVLLGVAAGWAALLYWIAPSLGAGPAYLAGLVSTLVTFYWMTGCFQMMREWDANHRANDQEEEYGDEEDEDDDEEVAMTDEETDEIMRRVYLDLTPAMRRRLRARRG